jgi:hypothetical protein
MLNRANLRLWAKAFWIVLRGGRKGVAGGHKWKESILIGAMTGFIFSPFAFYALTLPYQGAIPPDMNVITGYGRVIFTNEKAGMKNIAIADFSASDGRLFRLQDTFATLPEIQDFERLNPLDQVYVEGFYLNNGFGKLWIIYAATRDGRTLLSREQREMRLRKRRETFGMPLLWMYIFLVAPLSLISFFNVRKVRTSLGPEND